MDLLASLGDYRLHMRSNGYSKSTVDLYCNTFKLLAKYLDNPEVEEITPDQLASFRVFLYDEYVPNRKNGSKEPLSRSTHQNHHRALKSYFSCAVKKNWVEVNPTRFLEYPEDNPAEIKPLSLDEVKKLLESASSATLCNPSDRKPFLMLRRTATRDVAIILLLLDTGIRVGELCRLKIKHINLGEESIHVKAYNSKRKTKDRGITLTNTSLDALWRYALKYRKNAKPEEPFFLSNRRSKGMTENGVRQLFSDLCVKAGIGHIHPHQFRHTYAIESLRNGVDPFTLQMILGHSDLETVKKYIMLAKTDIAKSQKKYSPLVGWNLTIPMTDENSRSEFRSRSSSQDDRPSAIDSGQSSSIPPELISVGGEPYNCHERTYARS